MSDEKALTEPRSAFQAIAIGADMSVDINDVVSAFVAKYEGNLFARKKELSATVKRHTEELAKIEKDVKAQVTGAEFVQADIQPFDLFSELSGSTISWDKGVVSFSVSIKTERATARDRYYSSTNSTIVIKRVLPIPANLIGLHKDTEEQAAAVRAELHEVLEAIKSIARKEREVRGRIAIRKLEDAGYEDLMQDAELAALVQLD